MTNKIQSKHDVIIVGGGMAGLGAADHLSSNGFSVVVLEARNRIGGRTWTDSSLGFSVDMGGSWIHGTKNNRILELTKKYGIDIFPIDYWSQPNIIFDYDGVQIKDKNRIEEIWNRWHDFEKFMNKLNKNIKENGRDISVGYASQEFIKIKKLSKQQIREFNFALMWNVESYFAADVSKISLRYYFDDADSTKGTDFIIPDGYKKIIDSLSKGLDVRLNHVVTRIEYNCNEVHVITNNGNFDAKYAIMTIPLGTLKGNTIQFKPPLPRKKNSAIKQLGIGLMNKVYFLFPDVFWQKAEQWITYIPKEKSRWGLFLNLYPVIKKPVLEAFNFGSSGYELEKLSDQEIISDAMRVLRKCYGTKIPEPENFRITRWGSDEFSMGSYSYTTLGTISPDSYNELAKPIMNRIFFAGESTDPLLYGTTEAAFNSGIRESKRIHKLEKSQNRSAK